MRRSKFKRMLKKFWRFLWDDNSIWSWILNVIIAFVLIKFIVYPGLGFLLGTNYPIVAVVSGSMEHKIASDGNDRLHLCDKFYQEKKPVDFDYYWKDCGEWYESNTDITKENFNSFRFKNGFNKGDIMILIGADPENIAVGDVLVYWSSSNRISDPIIHRVVETETNDQGFYALTKGDHNADSDKAVQGYITKNRMVGKAIARIPLLGYIKIWFVELIKLIASLFKGVIGGM